MDYMDISSIKFYKSYEEFVESKKSERIILATTKAKDIYTYKRNKRYIVNMHAKTK